MSTPTLDWDAIQERNIDANTPVDSDNTNKLLKVMGEKAYCAGLDLSWERDVDNNRMLALLTGGIVVMDYVAIEFLETSCIVAFQCPITACELAIVVEYKYSKVMPHPIAVIKTIPWNPGGVYDSTKHMVLYRFKVKNWDVVPTMEEWLEWLALPGNLIDCRLDYMPEWVNRTFVRRDGRNTPMTGVLRLVGSIPSLDDEAVPLFYLNDRISTHTHDGRYILRDGDTIEAKVYSLGADSWFGAKSAAGADVIHMRGEGPTSHGMIESLVGDIIASVPYERKFRVRFDGDKDLFAVTQEGTTRNPELISIGGDLNFSINTGQKYNYKIDGISILTKSSDTDKNVRLDSYKKLILNAPTGQTISFRNNDTEVAYVNNLGVVGSLYNADFVEFFNHGFDLNETPPKQGTCMVFNKDGNAVKSSGNPNESVIGLVSYNPGLILGGSYEFDMEYKDGRIPIALVGQIDNVEVFSYRDFPAGTKLTASENGILKAMDGDNQSVIAIAMEPLCLGTNIVKVLLGR